MKLTLSLASISLLLLLPEVASRSLRSTSSKARVQQQELEEPLEVDNFFGQERKRALHKHSSGGGSGSGSGNGSYVGCLNISSEELVSTWEFSATAPSCSYTHIGENDGEDDCGSEDVDGCTTEELLEVVVSNEDVIANGTEYDVYEDFNITECETYSNLWVWDMALTCNATTLEDCKCNFAENLYIAGLLSCDDATRCPEACPICNTCLSIIGCNVTDIPDMDFGNGNGILSRSELLYVIAAAIAVVTLCLAVLIRSRKSDEKMEDLKKDLMAGESVDDVTDCDTHASQSYNPAWQPPKEIYSEFKVQPQELSSKGMVDEGPFDENSSRMQDKDLESPEELNVSPIVSLQAPVEQCASTPSVTEQEKTDEVLLARSTDDADIAVDLSEPEETDEVLSARSAKSVEELGEHDGAEIDEVPNSVQQVDISIGNEELATMENIQDEVNVDELKSSESNEKGESIPEEERSSSEEATTSAPIDPPTSDTLEHTPIDEEPKVEARHDDEAKPVNQEAAADQEDTTEQEAEVGQEGLEDNNSQDGDCKEQPDEVPETFELD